MNNIFYILKKELLETFRDKKSLLMMLVIPFLIPLMIIGFSALYNSDEYSEPKEYNIGFNYELSEYEKELAKEMEINTIIKSEKDLKVDYIKEEIDLYVTKINNKYILNGNDDLSSTYSISLMNLFYENYKQYLQTEYFIKNNINVNDVMNIINIEENIEVKEEDIIDFTSNYIVNYAFIFILMAMTVSASYPSSDTTAGEKERGTLETLFTFPIKSKDIIIGKVLSVSISTIITGLLSLILTIFSLTVCNYTFEIYKDTSIMLNGIEILYSLIIIITYSIMISGLSIAISSHSKTFKEAQSALTPLMFISMFPSMIAFMIEVNSSLILSIIPFINYTVIFSEIINNNINLLQISCMIISTILLIIIILLLVIRQYKSEKVLFSN